MRTALLVSLRDGHGHALWAFGWCEISETLGGEIEVDVMHDSGTNGKSGELAIAQYVSSWGQAR